MDDRVAFLDLPGGRIVGSLVVDDCLIVAQSNSDSAQDEESEWKYTDSFTCTVISLVDPENPEVLGEASHKTVSTSQNYGYGSDYLGSFLPDGSLLWYPAEQNNNYFLEPGIGGIDARADDFWYPYFPSSGKIYTVAINNKQNPQILSAVSLLEAASNEAVQLDFWPEGKMKLLDSILYYGLQTSEYVERQDAPSQWMARHWIGQLDLEDAAFPQKRELVEIPGSFEHVVGNNEGGTVLFSSSYQSFYENNIWRSEFRIQALAFDGLEAFLIDELVDQNQGYGPKLFENEFIVLGKTDYSSGDPVTELTTFEWLDSGSFLKHPPLQHPGAIYRLGVVDDLLIAPGSNELSFMDFTDPTDPARTSLSFPNLYFWQRFDLVDIYNREFAYLPQGWYGVEALDFEGSFSVSEESLHLPIRQADPAPEWIEIGVDLLSLTEAGSDLILGILEEGESWMYTDSVQQFSYEGWMRQVFELNEEDPVPLSEDDSDGDGLSNGFEYFVGTHPGNQLDAIPIESWVSEELSGNRYLNLRMPYNFHATEGVSLIPQFSYDLKNWATLPESFAIEDEVFNPAHLVRYLEPVGSEGEVFIRLLLSSESK
jgi:hypothetical protein